MSVCLMNATGINTVLLLCVKFWKVAHFTTGHLAVKSTERQPKFRFRFRFLSVRRRRGDAAGVAWIDISPGFELNIGSARGLNGLELGLSVDARRFIHHFGRVCALQRG
jgi:hypothetical protein